MKNSGYVSDELTHFVARAQKDNPELQYAVLLKILRDKRLVFDHSHPDLLPILETWSHMKLCDETMYRPKVVCFCDIPRDHLGIHMQKYGLFGIGFPKEYMLSRGANPVFYIAKDGLVRPTTPPGDKYARSREEHTEQLFARFHAARKKCEESRCTNPDTGHTYRPLGLADLEIACGALEYHVFSFFKCFDASRADQDPENFYMEREWRVVGYLPFEPANVARIYLPKAFAARLGDDFSAYAGRAEPSEDIQNSSNPGPPGTAEHPSS